MTSQGSGRVCVFCGGSPTTKEHVLPKWIRKFLPEGNGIVHEWRAPGEEEPSRRWVTDLFDFQARVVCEPCNGGWMANLEGRARPFLSSMIRGNGRTLYPIGKAIVAFWALKTTLVLDAASPSTQTIPDGDYAALYRTQAVLPNTSVWMGANDFGAGAFAEARELSLADNEKLRPGYGATINVGHLVLEVARIEGEEGKTLKIGGQLAPALRRLWPREDPAKFPPPAALTMQQVVWLGQMIEHVPIEFS